MRILWSRPSLPAAITQPGRDFPQLPGESGAQYFARVVAHVRDRVPEFQAATATQIADDAIPDDRTFRDAWKVQAGAIVVDVPTARQIAKARMPDQTRHAAIDAARTPDEIKAAVRNG